MEWKSETESSQSCSGQESSYDPSSLKDFRVKLKDKFSLEEMLKI